MGLGHYLVEAHLREGRSVAELARTHGIHRSWLYKLLARYREQREAGLVPRSRRPHHSPAASSIWRVLRRRGLVTPQPHKRPRSSFVHFAAALPNECWQSDATHWTISGKRSVEIVNLIDDHSRLCL